MAREDSVIYVTVPSVTTVVSQQPSTTTVTYPQVGPRGPAATDEQIETLIEPLLESHEQDPTPHPAYDEDIQDLRVLFENGMV